MSEFEKYNKELNLVGLNAFFTALALTGLAISSIDKIFIDIFAITSMLIVLHQFWLSLMHHDKTNRDKSNYNFNNFIKYAMTYAIGLLSLFTISISILFNLINFN